MTSRWWYLLSIGLGIVIVLAPSYPAESGTDGEWGEGEYIWDLTQPPVPMPAEMGQGAGAVFNCEIESVAQVPYSDWAAVVSPTQDYGQTGLNVVHKEGMEKLGLDFWKEHDRVVFSTWLWGWHGWQPWSCAVKLGIR